MFFIGIFIIELISICMYCLFVLGQAMYMHYTYNLSARLIYPGVQRSYSFQRSLVFHQLW